MTEEFIAKIAAGLEQLGYLADFHPRIPGVQALLYARSPGRIRLGFATVEDHFLFIDWGNAAFGNLDQLKAMYRHFSAQVNQSFKIPHALRLTFPNLVVIAVSPDDFPQTAVSFARTTTFVPWYGGEAGQFILVNLGQKQIITLASLRAGRYPRYGALPLGHAIRQLTQVCEKAFIEIES